MIISFKWLCSTDFIQLLILGVQYVEGVTGDARDRNDGVKSNLHKTMADYLMLG